MRSILFLNFQQVHFEVPHPILVCTYTNVAVDNLVEGLVSSGVKALRVGFGGNVRSSLIEHTLDHKLETHPLQPALARLVKREEGLSARMMGLESQLVEVRRRELSGTKGLSKRGDNMQLSLLNMQNEQNVLKSRIYAMQQQMLRNVISEADVVCRSNDTLRWNLIVECYL
jgi:bifunctional ADP-heptose synthase (sugar kinase/adenylyltransferase)